MGVVGWAHTKCWHYEPKDGGDEPRGLTFCGLVVPKDRTVSRKRAGLDPTCMKCIHALDQVAKRTLRLEKS